jgi:hypothetical protein
LGKQKRFLQISVSKGCFPTTLVIEGQFWKFTVVRQNMVLDPQISSIVLQAFHMCFHADLYH